MRGADVRESISGKTKSKRRESQIATLFFVLYFRSLRIERRESGEKARESKDKRAESLYYVDNKQVKPDSNSVFFGGVDRTYVRYSHALFYPALLTFSIF